MMLKLSEYHLLGFEKQKNMSNIIKEPTNLMWISLIQTENLNSFLLSSCINIYHL